MTRRAVMIAAAAGCSLPPPCAHGISAAAGSCGAPAVEVAFVLDSTGSMGGLIEGAKQKIWSIANSIIAAEADARGEDRPRRLPGPGRRVRDEAVRPHRRHRRRLREPAVDSPPTAAGTTTESVNQALHEAVTGLSWSADRNVLKIIFLVGDYPPHMDYANDVKYPVTCREPR